MRSSPSVQLWHGALLALLLTLAPGLASTAAAANHLADSDDPYLLAHAHDPVDWYPWGPQALELARRGDKPIFLSIGYASCWWCHVAQRELFSDPAIAALLNRWFVNVLVDREQRPDIDQIYMLARQIMRHDSGWPNQIFLTPSLEPFYVGSTFAPRDTPQAEGFPTLLTTLHRNWATRRAEVERIAGQIAQAMHAATPGGAPPPLAPAEWSAQARATALLRFDALDGGFPPTGTVARFPDPPLLAFLLAGGARGDADTLHAAVFTLQAMAQGGIADQLAGGFRRYTVDPQWSVPHFEVMLSDNAQLLDVYARAAELTGLPDLRWVARRQMRFLLQRLVLPGGGFATSFDAQAGGVEGGTDLWTRAQITRVLGADGAARWFALYALVPLHAGDDAGVLRMRRDVAERLLAQGRLVDALAALRSKRRALLAARDRRVQPRRDDKLLVADNALAIGALSRAGLSLDDVDAMRVARDAAERIWRAAWNPRRGELAHQIVHGRVSGAGDLDDYAAFARACLALGASLHDGRWNARGAAVAEAMLEHFATPEGGLHSRQTRRSDLPFAVPLQGDGSRPAAQTEAVALLVELARTDADHARRGRWAEAARRALLPLQTLVAARPVDWPALLGVVDRNAALFGPQTEAPAAGGGAADCEGMPPGACSANRVSVDATWAVPAQRQAGGRMLAVHVRIAPGFHVNANPASNPLLIPTTLLADGVALPGVRYPPGQMLRPTFAPDGIAVWSGEVVLSAQLPAGVRHLALRVQACDATSCLLPATVQVALPPGR